MPFLPIGPPVQDADAFAETAFLGLARGSKRDPYRLSLFARHLDPDERPLAFVAVHGGTLVVTDRRLLEFRAHLEVHGAWNVKEFQGYEIRREIPRSDVSRAEHRIGPASESASPADVEDVLVLETPEGSERILVSRGPEPTLAPEEFETLRSAILGPQAK